MKVLKRLTLLVLSAVVLGAVPTSVNAQPGTEPCGADIQRFCPGVQAGGGRYRACLKPHEAELSPACQEYLKQAKAHAAAWRQACEADVPRLCSSVEPGGGNIRKCLREHQAEVSAPCKEQLGKGGPRRRGGAPASGQ